MRSLRDFESRSDLLLDLTRHMPVKQIQINDKPYLDRYYVSGDRDRDIWLHHFRSADGDRHLHNHPFEMESFVLAGGYEVEVMEFDEKIIKTKTEVHGSNFEKIINLHDFYGAYSSSSHSIITPFTWHRISSVLPDTWTICEVKAGRIPMWFFRDDEGEVVPMKSSSRDWHKRFKPRGVQ